jgi:hypothetical protein
MAIMKKIRIIQKIKIIIKIDRKIYNYSNNCTVNGSNISNTISYSIAKCVRLYQVQPNNPNIKNNQINSRIKINNNQILIKINEVVVSVDGVKAILV